MDTLVVTLLVLLLLPQPMCFLAKCPNPYCVCNTGSKRMTCESKNLTYIPAAPKYIKQLFFSGNDLPNISSSTFTNLSRTILNELRLLQNNIEHVSRNAFKNLKDLKYLDLSNNDIRVICFDPLNILNLFLQGNKLRNFPDFCNSKGIDTPHLQVLILAKNIIGDIYPTYFSCLTELKTMKLDQNPIRNLKNNVFTSLLSLETLSINHIEAFIEPFAFNISSLENLEFRSNKLKKGWSNFVNNFKYLPNLVKLNLEDSDIPSNSETLRNMFSPLQRLQNLTLDREGWTALPLKVFGVLPSLTYLSLSSNRIFNWNASEVFENVTSLKYLHLSDNGIRLINRTSFTEPMLQSLELIDVSRNPFSCTCDLLWFRNFINTSNISFKPFPKDHRCASPPEQIRRLLEDFNPTTKGCEKVEDVQVIISTTISSVIGISLITVAGVIYKCRWHIRYGIYLLRSKRKEYQQIPNDEEFLYDGFVIYCEEDREWVHGKLLQCLEDKEGFRLCIHYRDFDVGKLIVDNIVTNMDVSRKIICVMSNNFTRSKWCQFELLLAHDRVLDQDADALVLVMLSEIDTRHINSSLRALITTRTYAAWTDEEIGQNLFWDQIITAMGRSTNPGANP